MRHKQFVAFILTNGRPDRVYTYASLRRHGYTGKIRLVVDNEDKCLAEYQAKFPGEVVVFDKRAVSDTFDEGDNFGDRRAIVYARNACWKIAEDEGAKWFVELDDDYTNFRYKSDGKDQYCDRIDFDKLGDAFDLVLDFLESSKAASVAIAQGGDFLGGIDGSNPAVLRYRPLRKCMNTFFCNTSRPFKFIGRINEDVNTYTCEARRGLLFLTFTGIAIQQRQTQGNPGGMTELYRDEGTYLKSFYSVMYAPSCVTVSVMQSIYIRLHHRVQWRNAVPCILRESLRKK